MRGSFGAAMLVAMAALALTVGTAVAAPGGASTKPLWQASHDYYFNRWRRPTRRPRRTSRRRI